MDTAIVQKRVDDIAKAMVDKGLKTPQANAWVRSNQDFTIYLTWRSDADDAKSKFFYADRVDDALSDALNFIRAMPDRDQRNLAEFLEKLGSVIDLGRQHQIDVEFINPLVKTMKELSENALTHQKAVA
jgi:hypothetical protein